jgi:hypothetical protein
MADYTPTDITAAATANFKTGVRTSASNIAPTFTSAVRAASITENNNTFSFDNLVTSKPGFLTGRRPRFGLLFPRGNYQR